MGPPILSLFSGGSLERDFKKFFTNIRIEELPIPLVMVATSLTRGVTVPLYKGPVWLGFRASASLPGVLPPVHIDGELLVDGGGNEQFTCRPTDTLLSKRDCDSFRC